jgi:hypothetical protein
LVKFELFLVMVACFMLSASGEGIINEHPFTAEFIDVNVTLDINSSNAVWYYRTDEYPSGKVFSKAQIDMEASQSIGKEVIFVVDISPLQGPFTPPWAEGEEELFHSSICIEEDPIKIYLIEAYGDWIIFMLLQHGCITLKAEDEATVYRMLDLIHFAWKDP